MLEMLYDSMATLANQQLKGGTERRDALLPKLGVFDKSAAPARERLQPFSIDAHDKSESESSSM